MARVCTRKSGSRFIQFARLDGSGKIATISLGDVSKKAADAFLVRVKQLLEAKGLGDSLSPDLAAWVADRPGDIYARLVKAGLMEPRQKVESTKVVEVVGPVELKAFVDKYTADRTDVTAATKLTWRNVCNDLVKHFGENRDIRSITVGDAIDFRLHLIARKLASVTVSKRLKVCRQFFSYAVDKEIVQANPFSKVKERGILPEDRMYFVTRQDFDALIAVADPTWQTIFALARLGGLRCPNEVLSMQWSDVHWDEGVFIARSSKTARYGKASRRVPIFGDLKPFLDSAWDRAEEGAVFVVDPRYRAASLGPNGWVNCNLRTEATRLLAKAGLRQWPRLFQNMRSSRATELLDNGESIKHVTTWLGHSPEVCLKHYAQVTEAAVRKAQGTDYSNGAPVAVDCAVDGAALPVRRGSQGSTVTKSKPVESPEKQGVLRNIAQVCGTLVESLVGLPGFEPGTNRL